MKINRRAPNRPIAALSLLELLVIVAVIGGLSALLLPALSRVKIRATTLRARQEINDIAGAINQYVAAYNRFPVSTGVINGVARLGEDYTYGNTFRPQAGGSPVVIAGPGDYLNNNNELMAMLMDLEHYGDGRPTLNQGHVKNPHRTKFLSPPMAASTNAAGLGPDGVFRDPWGLPYIITLDLNGDGAARDIFYRSPLVSQDPAEASRGLDGLSRKTDANGNVVFEANSPVMVWSAGADRQINREIKAHAGVNRDNVLSWK